MMVDGVRIRTLTFSESDAGSPSEWTDTEFLDYVEIHSETPAARFSIDMVTRFCELAGVPPPVYVEGAFLPLHADQLGDAMRAARARVAHKSKGPQALWDPRATKAIRQACAVLLSKERGDVEALAVARDVLDEAGVTLEAVRGSGPAVGRVESPTAFMQACDDIAAKVK